MRQVNYLMSGAAHLPYLVVSLESLRHHWDGPTVVHAWPESYDIACEIYQDSRLQVSDVCLRRPAYRGKNSQFLDKIQLMMSLPKDTLQVYLDADTMPVGTLDPLFKTAAFYGFAATQFNAWVTGGSRGVIKNRIERLLNYEVIEKDYVKEVLGNKWPSPNGGIFACNPNSEVLPIWYEWSFAAKDVFISDETVLHVLQPKFVPTKRMKVIEGGIFNCSPKHRPEDLDPEDVVVWHFHGDSNVRPEKSIAGYEMWLPRYHEVLEANYGGIKRWNDQCVSENKWMRALDREGKLYAKTESA